MDLALNEGRALGLGVVTGPGLSARTADAPGAPKWTCSGPLFGSWDSVE